MKTVLPLFLFLLLGCLRLNAGNPAPYFYTYCLECGTPQNLTVQNLSGTSATLVWDAVAGATKYNIEVENTQNSSGSFHLDTTVTGTSFQLGGLQAGKTYKFKVRARCGGDHGDWAEWHFFTTGSGTSAPGDTTSANCAAPTTLHSVVTGTSALLSWNHVGNAGQYYLEVEDEQNQASNFHLEVQVSDTFYQLNGIQPNVLYKFKVSTHCDSSSHGPWSVWHFFNSSDSTSNPVDTSANCAAPTMLASVVTGTSALLSWNHVGNAGQYYLEVEDEQNQPSNFHLEVQVSDTFYQLNGIQPGVLYKFKVSTHCDSSSHGPWSNWQFFNGNSDSTSTGGNGGGGGGSCGKPAGLHVTGISSAAANLHWFAVPGAVSYTLEIERYQNSTSNPWQITQVVNTNSFHLTGLNANTRYKFKVRANCAGGHGDWSNWRKFKTALGVLSPAFFNPGSALEERAGSPTTPAPAFDSQIWPNPVKTTATIRLAHLKSETVSLRVMDLSGRTVLDRQFQPENAELEETISFQELPEGCYLVRVQNGADVKSTKLVVIR